MIKQCDPRWSDAALKQYRDTHLDDSGRRTNDDYADRVNALQKFCCAYADPDTDHFNKWCKRKN